MSDKRLYPNTVIFKGTDDNEITYINERVLEQIRAEIEQKAWEIAISDTDRANGMWDAYRIINKYTKD